MIAFEYDQRCQSPGEKKNKLGKDIACLISLEKNLRKQDLLRGLNVAICLHLEAKTAYMALVCRSRGKVVITGSNLCGMMLRRFGS